MYIKFLKLFKLSQDILILTGGEITGGALHTGGLGFNSRPDFRRKR